jgi:hypothetical protein
LFFYKQGFAAPGDGLPTKAGFTVFIRGKSPNRGPVEVARHEAKGADASFLKEMWKHRNKQTSDEKKVIREVR